MKKWKILSVVVICITAVILASCKSAKPPETAAPAAKPYVAQVRIQSGAAEYRTGNSADFAPAAEGTGILINDRVRSKPDAQVAIEFLDGSSLVLLANTEIEIQNYEVTRQANTIVSRIARVAVISGDVSGDVRQDLIYPPSVFEIVTVGEIYTIKGTLTQ